MLKTSKHQQLRSRLITSFFLGLSLLVVNPVRAERIKEMVTVAGERPNQLVGYGLVVGLDGTGDTVGQAPFAGQSLVTMLSALGVSVPPNVNIQPRNAAAVMITGELSALSRPGQRMDVTVSSLGNARSLKGGTLIMSPLKAADGQVYAQAQGSIVIPGVSVSSQRSRTSINHQSAGRIPGGAFVERSAPESAQGDLVELNFIKNDYAQTQRAIEAMVNAIGADAVLPVNSRTVNVRVPTEPVQRMNVMARLMEIDVPRIIPSAKVLINARTGSVVINEAVQLAPFAVTHGNLTIRVQASNQVVQPPPGTLAGRPSTQRNSQISIDNGQAGNMINVPGSASLEDLVRALNKLGATPQDLMGVLQAMKASGALQAELEII